MTTPEWIMLGIGVALLAAGAGVVWYAHGLGPDDVP